jgi:two-component system OmpR family response regulator
MYSKHILLVEDEEHLAVGIRFNLEGDGYRVTVAADGVSAVEMFDQQSDDIDLVILDLMLPRMSGYAVCEHLRDAGSRVPVLILSARTLTEDRTRGFDVGANQYLTKPFELEELLSRVRNLLAHHYAEAKREDPEQYTFGDATVDYRTREAVVSGKSVRLTELEFKLLRYFLQNEGRVIPRGELLENVWNLPGHVTTRAVDQFILRLRKTFEPDPAKPQHFITLRDAGYRFVK